MARKIKLMVATEELAELFLRRSQVKHLRSLKRRSDATGFGLCTPHFSYSLIL